MMFNQRPERGAPWAKGLQVHIGVPTAHTKHHVGKTLWEVRTGPGQDLASCTRTMNPRTPWVFPPHSSVGAEGIGTKISPTGHPLFLKPITPCLL